MINRNISIHLQDFPDVNFIKEEQNLVKTMDLVRLICSAALGVRDQKNLRVRLPLNKLVVIGKNAAQILDFKDIIAEEVNVKNIEIQENLQDLAQLVLKVNFKKIGAKYGSKIKEIMAAAKNFEFEQIGENEIKIAGINLLDDEFELKLSPKNKDDAKTATVALSDNSCLVSLDIEITPALEQEGIARDIVRAVQQARKDKDLDVSSKIDLSVFSSNEKINEVAKAFANYIKEQVLASDLKVSEDKNATKTKIDDGDLEISICVI
jgi:isoleucyl-tRNA synthetase